MRGLVRPCRHSLGPELRDRWRAHLCGLCLTLGAEAGQASRILTGYDVLLLSVLVEAQAGELPTTAAGPCPLRGMRGATVVAADTPAMQLAAAGGLLAGAAGLTDKLGDRDLPAATRPIARRAASRFEADGTRLASRSGLPVQVVLSAPSRAADVEARRDASLEELLAPTGAVVGQLFATTAHVAGTPSNAAALRRAGDAFGRLVHLADAIADADSDRRAGAHNPLTSTGTAPASAGRLAQALHATVVHELAGVDFADRALVDALFDRTLRRAVSRLVPAQREPGGAVGAVGVAAVAVAATAAVFGGPPQRRRTRFGQRRYYDDPRYDPRYDARYDPRFDPRYRYGGRRGPSCCQLLACDCCASCACSEATGGDCCVCCV